MAGWLVAVSKPLAVPLTVNVLSAKLVWASPPSPSENLPVKPARSRMRTDLAAIGWAH
ncbi:hypothetical protein LAUMK4_04431 [Mycobacterium persicum]|uniref:Uncharacterized protein n=1 Tax=Mycobacterium persicum TaxID=1487726 RepID=A0ABY6RNP2_9MYCO|nr:hypothetical protein LAUMK15_04842 [Mycobacterium persicum]VAZ98957.1 hypothetical protein LAUMK4_04431 [Mycobacterium persicum]